MKKQRQYRGVYMVNAVITGVGGFVPEDIITNDDLAKLVDTNDEWIMTRAGIRERRILKEGKAMSYMGIQAVNDLLQKTGVSPESIDGLICATSTSDYPFPTAASMIAYQTGCKNAFAFDLQAAC